VRTVLDRWATWLRVERGLAPNTIATYRADVAPIARRARAIDGEALRAWLYSGEWKPATIARRMAAARSLFGWLVRTGLRSDDPTQILDRPKVTRGLPRPVEDLSVRLQRLDEPYRSIAVFMAETGVRIAELYGLERPEIADAVLVHGKGRKDRWIALTPVASEALERVPLPLPITMRTLQRRFAAAGFSPHRLRHTLGCDLARAGVDLGDIQQILGHSSPVTTTIYAAFGLDRQRAAQARRRGAA
jgi:site-specific recombinase XerD